MPSLLVLVYGTESPETLKPIDYYFSSNIGDEVNCLLHTEEILSLSENFLNLLGLEFYVGSIGAAVQIEELA
jgi:hypothetical protein